MKKSLITIAILLMASTCHAAGPGIFFMHKIFSASTCTMGTILTQSMYDSGQNYTAGNILSISGGIGGTITVLSVAGDECVGAVSSCCDENNSCNNSGDCSYCGGTFYSNRIDAYSLSNAGYGYSTGIKSLTGGSGSGALLSVLTITCL